MSKHLLIVWHSQSGHTEQLAEAVLKGAQNPEIDDVDVRSMRCQDATANDVFWADGILFGTPENFGYMSGAMKEFLDRTYYDLLDKVQPLPYAIFISAGNDGRGAVAALQRILRGYAFHEVQEALVCRGRPKPEHHVAAEELGMTLAAGLSTGIY